MIFLILLLFAASVTQAQFNEFNPEYNWQTIRGKHIYVHYHPEAERTAAVVAKIADEVWDPITSLYEYEPKEVHYVIKDIDDYANGATYFFDNKIEIWASSLDFDLRGAHNWLRNVISHEFTHMVQIQAAMKTGRRVPAVYLQFLNYEDKRRPDILYGFPNFIVSYPLASINMPAWFAEGTAQYMRTEFDYDNWDTHRDMILRSYVLDGNMLTWNQMGVFGKTSLGNESVYNSGFALTRYISQKYGEDKLRTITKALGNKLNFTIDAAIEDVLGITGNELYLEWKNFLQEDYEKRIAAVKQNIVQGELIEKEGFGNFYPKFSKDGNKFLYISNKMSDYFSTSVYEYDFLKKESRLLQTGIRSTVSWLSGEKKILYSKLSDDNPKWANIHDLYIYDIEEEEEERITSGLRADNPALSPDENSIVFVFQKDGTSNIGIVGIDGKNFSQPTNFRDGEQVYNPRFTPDGKSVIFDYSYHHGRDVATVGVDGNGFSFLFDESFDERNAIIKPDGEIIYCTDETGIFNIYSYNPATKEKTRLTNVTGSAFMPDIDSSGNIIYAGYTSTGYKIFRITKEEQKLTDDLKRYEWIGNPPLSAFKPNGDIDKFDIVSLNGFQDRNISTPESERYSGKFSDLTFFPLIRFDNYNISNSGLDKIKPGLFFTSSDMLNRYSIFGGASFNKRFERDVFLSFEYRNKLPLLYDLGLKPEIVLDLYSISRKTNTDILLGVDYTGGVVRPDYIIPTDVTYNLFEFDIAARHRVFARGNQIEFRFIFSRYSAELGSFILPTTPPLLYPTTNDVYFIGKNLQFKYSHESNVPYLDSDINPIGRDIDFTYNYEINKINTEGEYEVADGVLKPLYENVNFHRVEFDWKEHIKTFDRHTLSFRLRTGTIFGPAQDDFFDFYLGGLIGMRGYPFYAISGNELAWLNVTYRMPLFRNIDARLAHIYIDKIFLSVFGDYGNAWTGKIPSQTNFKKGAGAELRIKMESFYLFPTSVFFSAAYAFDSYDRVVRDQVIKYGKEWQFYGGILFDFSF